MVLSIFICSSHHVCPYPGIGQKTAGIVALQIAVVAGSYMLYAVGASRYLRILSISYFSIPFLFRALSSTPARQVSRPTALEGRRQPTRCLRDRRLTAFKGLNCARASSLLMLWWIPDVSHSANKTKRRGGKAWSGSHVGFVQLRLCASVAAGDGRCSSGVGEVKKLLPSRLAGCDRRCFGLQNDRRRLHTGAYVRELQ